MVKLLWNSKVIFDGKEVFLMSELSYSLHLGSDKNRKQSLKGVANDNPTGTSSLSNNAIQNSAQLSKVNKHNLRKYENNTEQIQILQGSNNLFEDVQSLYLQEFEESRQEYNAKQPRNDRKIKNYFEHISKDKLRDLACEIVIELGDKDFWQDKDIVYWHNMGDVYNEQIKDLTKLIPAFKVANAVVHFDESSPHLHIVGVPVSDNNTRLMKKQVAKSKTFTKETLAEIQDEMRKCCIKSFNRIYGNDLKLKSKQKGRNQDVSVKDMAEYKDIKKNFEEKKQNQAIANKSADSLNEKCNVVEEKLKLLKPTALNKNKYTISKEDIDTIRSLINDTKGSAKDIKDAYRINNLVNKAERENQNKFTENFLLKLELKEVKEEVETLKYKIDEKDTIIEKLQKEVEKFKGLYHKFRGFWKGIIRKFQEKIGYEDNKEYRDIINELLAVDVLSKRDKDIIEDPTRTVITEEELAKKQKMKGAR